MGRGKESAKPANPRSLVRAGRSRLRGRVMPDRRGPRRSRRWHAIGAVRNELGAVAVLVVVHVDREEHNGEEIIRIISARAAEKHELRRYQEQKID